MILKTKVSKFSSTRDIEVNSNDNDVGFYLNQIKNGEYKDIINKVRSGNSEDKKQLPTVAMHGLFDGFRRANCFSEASGLIILDIDDVEVDDLESTKKEIMEDYDSVLATMISPSGNGIKVLYYINPDIITADNYRQIGKQLVNNFDIYGNVDYLSVTDCLIMSYDPNILINEDATPELIFVEEKIISKKELPERDFSLPLWEDAEDFYDTVLVEEISKRTNNNYHFIQVSMLDLAKFGFYHPEHDLSFVIDYSENYFKYSSENKTRFKEVAEIAKQYQQTAWAYKTFNDEEEDEGELDYSQYISHDVEGDEDFGGMVDYSNFFDKVMATAKEGDRVGFEISLKNFADVFRWRGTGIMTVTGIPGAGKTEFLDQCLIDLARLHKQDSFIVGFEQSPEEHVIKLIRKMVGLNITCPSYLTEDNEPEVKRAYDFVTKHIKHVNTTKVGGDINKILEILAEKISVSRENGGNPKYVVLDPFNMLSIKGKFSGHEKVEEILRRLTQFSHKMGVMVILVAHPTKMSRDEKTGEFKIPDFYSVKGSSAFFEMSYHGMVVYRKDNSVLVRILKVKQNNLGTTNADVFFTYDKPSGRYYPIDEDFNELSGDHRSKDWLEKALKN